MTQLNKGLEAAENFLGGLVADANSAKRSKRLSTSLAIETLTQAP
jgi:hypothetical protein